MKRRTKAIVTAVVAIPLVAVALIFVAGAVRRSVGSSNLARCRSDMISEIERMAGNQAWLAVKDSTAGMGDAEARAEQPEGPWLTDHLIQMQNGERLVYSYRCSKEDRRKGKLLPGLSSYDVFIGRGEDGKWHYTSYHFCIGMLMLGMGGQPESFAAFADEYLLREFDGRAENCPAKTWPPRN